MNRLGEVLRELRQQRKLTQGELGAYAGVDQSYISRLERGESERPSGKVLERLAARLGVTVDYILARAEGRPISEDDTYIEQATHLLRRLPEHRRPEWLEHIRVAVEYSPVRPQLWRAAEEQAEYEVEQRTVDDIVAEIETYSVADRQQVVTLIMASLPRDKDKDEDEDAAIASG